MPTNPERHKDASKHEKYRKAERDERRHKEKRTDYNYSNVGFTPGGVFGIDPEIAGLYDSDGDEGLHSHSFSGDSSAFYGGPFPKKKSPNKSGNSSSWLPSFLRRAKHNGDNQESLSDSEQAHKEKRTASSSSEESSPLDHTTHKNYGTIEKSLEKRNDAFHPRSRRA
ncbi:hypothetical protein JCM3765_003042 [Sporobolomyces pararoseus]